MMESLVEERRQRLQEQWRQLYASHDLETRVDEKMRIKAIIDPREPLKTH
ncbi:hypothetical protein [Thiothrix winogradskyi]|uniref:Uncharacterized protein n=1 Tax=Thiothrix winogradskyi TaxID=96472 RepID=A0ABY3SYI1_9GAMM|nr:hypothetical protein [Thiothrix winogradskyi]UJS24160.1 hypothetical protein L2Y54_19860 [Thiothrix winogradskyi]